MTGGRVEGKIALVTGGGSGIGRSICIRLAEEGAEVVFTSRTAEHVETVADEVAAATGRRRSRSRSTSRTGTPSRAACGA